MSILEAVFANLVQRAELLVPLLAAGFFIGELIARITGVEWLVMSIGHLAAKLERKLNRPDRSVATRVYRGMIALGMLLIPTVIVGILLIQDRLLAHWASLLLMVALFGHGFGVIRQWRYWHHANRGQMKLELPGLSYLFADSHAVLRYLILTGGERFAVYVVGASVAYIAGGVVLVLAYLMVAELAHHHHGAMFGWAANALFRLVDFIPRLLTLALLLLAGLFVPGAKPLRARKARSYYGFLAYLTDSALGGTLPSRELPWAGEGTPKALPVHLARWLLLEVAATVMWLLLLGSGEFHNLLNSIV